jgi:acyl-CoA dehydrogenase
MSVPYNINAQKEQASEELLVGSKGQQRASEKIPMIARGHVSDRAKKTLDIVSDECQAYTRRSTR